MIYAILIAVVSIILALRYLVRERPHPSLPPASSNNNEELTTTAMDNTTSSVNIDEIYSLAESLEEFYQKSAYPSDLLSQENFQKGVELFCSDNYSGSDVLGYYNGANLLIACMALEALARRTDDIELVEPITATLNEHAYWPRYYALRTLDKRCDQPILNDVLLKLDETWGDPVPQRILREFVTERLKKETREPFGDRLNDMSESDVLALQNVLTSMNQEEAQSWVDEVREWSLTRVDVDFLKTIGRILFDDSDPEVGKTFIEHEALVDTVNNLETTFTDKKPRSVVMVGEPGVGKTAIARILGRRLAEKGWTIFEAGAVDILAGQVYIGQLEDRIQQLVRKISGKRRILWIIPNFHEMMWAGSHRSSPTAVLDMIFPFLENGTITILGETRPTAYEKLVQHNSRIKTALDGLRIYPLVQDQTLSLTREWVREITESKRPIIKDDTLQEAFQLTQQYLGDKAAPGNLLSFLELTWKRLISGKETDGTQISLDDMLITLSRLTGLPHSILDDREGLDLSALRQFFQKQVMGQQEAIDVLVERIAMIKAGLTDPTRPAGVFLFAGPTGTGKTEMAKALAEYLFGSPQRMIRLDMSEFQNRDSLDRIIGESDQQSKNQALVNLIRKQPFSVILLDEFEKANPYVWDLFLQVFDDGRLTDRRGNTADFRHSIIIMTSNLGGLIPRGAGIGFNSGEGGFESGSVTKAIEKEFRKEFINRIDRVVVFHPLSRTVMRNILKKDLSDVLQRRGLRNRTWAVEWHESAIEFLLDKGFTADLGARPLKRAIERYLLSPLALTIVNHQFPEGDQFLFVRSNGKQIEVEFIDPDGGDPDTNGVPAESEIIDEQATEDLRVEMLIIDPQANAESVHFLQEKYSELTEYVKSDDWQVQKDGALAHTANPDFWHSPDRFRILGIAEYMDRIEAGFSTATRLLERLVGPQGDRKNYSVKLVSQLAHQLYLLDAACRGLVENEPHDAFIRIEARHDSAADSRESDDFAARIGSMYQGWARKRRMRHKVLFESNGSAHAPYKLVMAVSGYAAFAILKHEIGLHVFEVPKQAKSFKRIKAMVEVVPQPEEPAGNEQGALYKQCQAVFDELEKDDKMTIVRRYREEPSPLVRDSVRNWRTGRFERVIEGDFDLII